MPNTATPNPPADYMALVRTCATERNRTIYVYEAPSSFAQSNGFVSSIHPPSGCPVWVVTP